MFTSMYVDMFFAQDMNASLVASDPSFLWKNASLLQWWDAGTSIVFNAFGPLYTIDLYLMSPPNFLVELVQVFSILTLEKRWRVESTAALLDDICRLKSASQKYKRGKKFKVYLPLLVEVHCVHPSTKQPITYCKNGDLTISRQSLLFAIFASISKSSSSYQLNSVVCDWVDDTSMCQKSIGAAIQFVSQYEINHTVYSLFDEATRATSSIEIVQLALNRSSGTSVLLRHAIIDPSDQAFAFVGWSYLYDWTVGDREVASFQGDVCTYDLISYKYTSNVPSKPLSSEFPNSVARFVELGVIYVMCSSNFFFFNRVVGPTWVGRPLLLMRGCMAILLLSTPGIQLETRHGLTKFNNKRRSLLESALVAGESTWVSYVVADILLLSQVSWVAGPFSSAICLMIAFVLDVSSPLDTTVSGTSVCDVDARFTSLSCSSACVSNGSFSRLVLLVLVNIFVQFGVVRLVRLFKILPPKLEKVSLLYSGASLTFFNREQGQEDFSTGIWHDSVSNVMSGVFVLRWPKVNFVFDITSWHLHRLENDQTDSAVASTTNAGFVYSRKIKFFIAVAFAYIVATLSSSLFYLFNTTGAHRFLATVLQLDQSKGRLDIEDPKYALVNLYNTPRRTILTFASQASRVKFSTLSLLEQSITGLRQMHGCSAPWIPTQYCWVDFKRNWVLANSLERQQRCEKQQLSNAAVYLEAILRNINHEQFMSCWHDSFTTAIATELSLSAAGKVWLQTTLRDPILSIQGEWQNYKLPGLIQTIQVENAFGVQYPLTLQSRNGTWRLSDQTSMKMYWSFASDLWACGLNASGIGGSSLIRQTNQTLPRVMTWATQLFEQHIGPYGSIDVHYILPPKALVALSTNLTKELQALCYTKPLWPRV
ncbi:hypothetical protein AeMF1_011539 [Aphanomyces euteiches]|nr:hypothetical protein AeMF1_011539 [Aphanomyces euteiches]KAH9193747.1 hypothetical protein AeNC1_004278 [Aphanomyces euteiches]